MPAPPLPPDPTKHPPPTPAATEGQSVPATVVPVSKPAPLIEVVMYNILGDNWKTDVQGLFIGFSAFVAACALLHVDSFHELFQFKTLIAVFVAAVPIYVGKKQMDAKPK